MYRGEGVRGREEEERTAKVSRALHALAGSQLKEAVF